MQCAQDAKARDRDETVIFQKRVRHEMTRAILRQRPWIIYIIYVVQYSFTMHTTLDSSAIREEDKTVFGVVYFKVCSIFFLRFKCYWNKTIKSRKAERSTSGDEVLIKKVRYYWRIVKYVFVFCFFPELFLFAVALFITLWWNKVDHKKAWKVQMIEVGVLWSANRFKCIIDGKLKARVQFANAWLPNQNITHDYESVWSRCQVYANQGTDSSNEQISSRN